MPRPTASTPLRLYLLGPFRLERGKEPLRLSTRKVESLLAFLVLHPEEHSREKLAALFWGDSPDAQARDSLRTALKNLRKALGDELLLADREAIQLNPEYPLWVDAREFEQTADDRPQTTHAQTAVSGLSSAVTLYRGDLLTDFYDEWILPERERLRELYLATLLRLTQDARTRGEYAQAIELAKKVLALDAANERAHRHLMFCYHANGDRAAALKQHEACVRILRDELGVAPSPETTALYEEIKSAVSEIPAPETQLTNLPIPLTSFVGRQREIEEIKAILARERLVTLTGAGGSGKTRLAIEVARGFVGAVAHHHARELSTDEFQDRVTMRQESPRPYTDGVWWVELAALSDAALVPQAIAQVLAVREVSHQPMLETLANHLRARQLLLLLDNCEHLINACAELADSLLSMCPHLKILATSREALGILGESVYQVPSLLLPLTLDVTVHQVLQYEATRLFVERASAANARFALTTQNAPAVAQICRRLDGIPLAIELAAARARLLTVEHIAERLNDRFNLLTQGSRAALPRQQTLRATIDWSYDLLPDDARTLFRRLSVFAGGFTLDAAEAVCADPSPVSPAPTGQGTGRIGSALVLDELARLVDRSLVLVEQRGESERYRMLETIREYAAEKLRQAGEDRSVRNRHLAFFLDLSEQAEPNLEQGQPHALLDRLETELDNVRAAVEWALEDAQPVAALRLVAALRRFWMPLSAHRSEGVERLTEILARPDAKTPTRARLKALNAYLFLLWPTRELTGAQAFLEEALALAAKLGDRRNLARALWLSAVGAIERGDSMLARSSLQQSIELYHELGDERGMAMSLSLLGDVAMLQGDYAHAEASYEEAIPRLREARDFTFLAMPLRRLGQLAMYHGDKARSARLIKESLISNWSVHDYVGVGGCLAAFAALSMAQGQNERAVKLLRAVDALLEYIHFPLLPFDQQQYERTVSELRAHMNEAVFAKAWAEGRTLTLEQAVELALATASDAAR